MTDAVIGAGRGRKILWVRQVPPTRFRSLALPERRMPKSFRDGSGRNR